MYIQENYTTHQTHIDVESPLCAAHFPNSFPHGFPTSTSYDVVKQGKTNKRSPKNRWSHYAYSPVTKFLVSIPHYSNIIH